MKKRGGKGLRREEVLGLVEALGSKTAAAQALGVTLSAVSYHIKTNRKSRDGRRREEVLHLFAELGSSRKVAEKLGITRQAVEDHIKRGKMAA